MVNKRMCLKVQDEFHDVAMRIKDLVVTNLDHRLDRYFGPPCITKGFCQIAAECERQFQEGKLTGADNTSKCCPLYVSNRTKLTGGK